MTKLIERIGKETKVDGKPIDLSLLVNMGAEIIDIGGRDEGLERYRKRAIDIALATAEKYGCHYVMLGQHHSHLVGEGGPADYLVIANFFNERK